MNGYISSKLNLLLRQWPRGAVAVSSWLTDKGVYPQLIDTYLKSGWIERIGHGAFIRGGDQVDWTGALFAIQEQLHLPIHVGGKTSLEMFGYSQNIPLSEGRPVYLFGLSGQRMPKWFSVYNWKVKVYYTMVSLFHSHQNMDITSRSIGDYHITLSSPERAIMELLYFVPKSESFEEASLFMEGLTTLRPSLVQELLINCCSVKVRRLFMYLAEECHLPWVPKVDLSNVNFGKGKRVIVKNSHYDQKYKITVPKLSYVREKLPDVDKNT